MPPDEDGEGRGHGLAMLRLEARRYKREMQQIWMQRQLYEQRKSTSSLSTEDSSRVRDDRWKLSDTFTTSPATSGTPMFWNREDVPVSRLEQLAIVEEGTQTDSPSKSEVQTETEKPQYDDVISSMRESGTVSSAVNNIYMLKTCSRHCDELRSRISQEAACECLAEAALRVNADVLFTAKPKRVTVEGQVEVPDGIYSRAFRSTEIGIGEQTSTMATSPSGSLNKGQKSTDLAQDFRTGLRSLVSPLLRHDSACSPIPNLHECEAKYKRLGDKSEVTERFPSSQEKFAPERSSTIAPPPLSTQVSTPQLEALCGVTKAGDNTPDSSTEISGSKRIRNESTGEGAMAARLATKIKHALEAIGGKEDTRSASSIFNLPGRTFQSTSACRLHYKEQYPEMRLFENVGESFKERPLNGKEISSSDSSLRETCHQARAVCVNSGKHHTNSTLCSDTDIYFQNGLDTLCTDRSASNKLSDKCIPGEVSAARAAQRAERRPEASRRASVKSCGDHHASHQADGIEKSVKTDVRQSGIKHVMEKRRLLSNVQKLQNVAETAKRLYTDLVDCAYDELRSSTDCGNLVKHQDGDGARDISKFARSEFCPSTEIISAHRADEASTDNNEVCGRCFVCQPQLCKEQPPEESQTGSLDEITIELSEASPTNIMVSRNGCTERPRYNVEVSTHELPCQRVSSPNNRCGNIVRRQSASWKDTCKPAIRKTTSTGPGSDQIVKKGFNKCLLDPHCDGPRDCCHMPTRGKCSRASTVCISSPKRSSTMCLLDPRGDGPRNRCHKPTRAKCSGATTVCISPPKKSTKYLLDSCCDGPRKSCHMPTREERSGTTTVCISPSKKDSNMCCLDPSCVGSRNSCHMPTYSKSSRASCGPGGSSRIKRNNGTKLGNKNPSGLSRCLVHRSGRMESVKGNLERNLCRERFQSAQPNNLDDENHGLIFLYERKHNSPARRCRDISKLPEVLDVISKVGTLREARAEGNLCMTHNDVRSSSMKGNEIKVGIGGHEETAGLHYTSSERMDLNNLVRNVHRSVQECSQTGIVKNYSTLTAAEDIGKETASVGKETRQPTAKHITGNASALAEAHTQTTQPQNPPSDNVNRAVAAAGLANEIEVIVADQPGKSNRRIKQTNYLTSQRKLSDGQTDSFGQTKLDVAVIAAANAVKKLKPVSLLPLVKQVEGNQKATPRKGLTPRTKLMAEDTIGSSFYDQMYKELEELSSERMQLVRQERAQFPAESLVIPHQHDRHAGFFIKRRSSSDLKNLANAVSEVGESTRSVRMQRSEESPRLWHESISSHTPGSKRQRSATSPAREHCNKLLRLSVGKVESQAGRKRQDQHSTLSVSLNQAVTKSNKGIDRVRLVNFEPLSSEFSRKKGRSVSELDVEKLKNATNAHLGRSEAYRMNTSSAGRWKPAPKEAQAKTTTKRNVLAKRKVRPPAWVERMSKAKNVFSSLIRPLLLAHFGKERLQEANVHREASQPPRLMVRSSVTSKQFGKRIAGGRGFSLMQPNPPRIHSKKFIMPNQYDINTGRKIAHGEQEPGELLHVRVENQHMRPSPESLHEKNIKMTRRSIVKHGIMSSAVTTLSGNLVSARGWNADPSIRSDIPHKAADIIRYNRNGGLNVQIRRRDGGGRDKSSTSTSVRQMNIRHVTFAGMVVHNSRNEKIRKGLISTQSVDSLEPQVVTKKASSSQLSMAKRTLGKRRSSSAGKIPPTQGKLHRYGGGGGKWTYHEGFWTEMFNSELEKVSQDDSLQSLLTPGSIAEPGTPSLELRTAQVLDTLYMPVERAGPENLLTVDPSLVLKRTDDEDVTVSAGERNSSEKHDQSFATNSELRIERAESFSEDERAESFSETKSKILSGRQAQVSIVNRADQDLERREPILSSEEFPHSPLRLLDEVFPDSSENEALVSMFDRLQVATSVPAEPHSEKGHKAQECVTPQTFLDTSDHENEGLLKNLELERTLVDLALHTILHDDFLQPSGISVTGVEPISLPINRRLAMRADKEVEAIVHARDMSQSPLSKAIPCVDRATEQDIIPHVDRATELHTVPHVDRATELDNFFLSSKDQDSQTMDADFGIRNIQRFTLSTQEKSGAKLQNTQVQHQATECRVPWNTVGIQIPDTTATISASSPCLPDSMPMLMPVFFQQLGTSMFPIVFPTVNFSTSSNLQSRPVSTVTDCFPAGEEQGAQATESQIHPNPREIAAQALHQDSKLPISSRAALGQLGAREEENASDWEEESTRGSSPSTPSTPLSSPNHKLSLRKAMQLCPDKCSVQEFTVFARKDPEPVVSEVCQESNNDCLQAHQTLVKELTPPIRVATDSAMEEITTGDPSLIASANETRRGTSWARVKEMEEAAITLLRAASMKTPSATSSSECSQENSPDVVSWMSPGEVNIEEFKRSRAGRRFVNNSRTSQENLGKLNHSHAWSWLSCGRTSIGEVYNPVCLLGSLSEGEIEAGVVPSLGELGQVQNARILVSHCITDLQGQGSEPGEIHMDPDASSPLKSPTHEVVSEILTEKC